VGCINLVELVGGTREHTTGPEGLANPLVVRSLKPAGVKAIPFEPAIAFQSHILFNQQRPVPALARWFLACLQRVTG
jgi:hypothetical protein